MAQHALKATHCAVHVSFMPDSDRWCKHASEKLGLKDAKCRAEAWTSTPRLPRGAFSSSAPKSQHGRHCCSQTKAQACPRLDVLADTSPRDATEKDHQEEHLAPVPALGAFTCVRVVGGFLRHLPPEPSEREPTQIFA